MRAEVAELRRNSILASTTSIDSQAEQAETETGDLGQPSNQLLRNRHVRHPKTGEATYFVVVFVHTDGYADLLSYGPCGFADLRLYGFTGLFFIDT